MNNLSANRLIIIGAGDLGKQLCYYYSHFRNDVVIAGFADDTKETGEEVVDGLTILGSIGELKNLQFEGLVMGIGYHHLSKRSEIFRELTALYSFETFIHPHAFVDSSASLGKGVFISSGCVIEKDVVVGDNVFLFNSVTIAHNVIIKNGSFLGPSVTVAGNTVIEDCCFAGAGSVVINDISLCGGTYLGAGSLVLKSINEPGWYAGQPCKKIKK